MFKTESIVILFTVMQTLLRDAAVEQGRVSIKMPFDIRFPHPFTALVVGPSNSGKTVWVSKFLKAQTDLIKSKQPIKHVHFYYDQYQSVYGQMLRAGIVTKLIQGFPDYNQWVQSAKTYKSDGGLLAVFDDSLSATSELVNMFTIGSHHQLCSCIVISQQLFGSDPNYRIMTYNCMFLILMKTPRNARGVITLASQISPYRSSYVVDSYRSATRLPYGYLVFDFTQKQSDSCRLRTNILPGEEPVIVFVQNS